MFGPFPAGMMLIRSDSGQLILVSQQALAQVQQGPRGISGQAPRILAPQVCVKWTNIVTSDLDSCGLNKLSCLEYRYLRWLVVKVMRR